MTAAKEALAPSLKRLRISEEIERHLGIEAGENTPDMLYTVEEVHCVGACGMAPVVMINDQAHGQLTPEKAVKVVKTFQAEEDASTGEGRDTRDNGGAGSGCEESGE